MIGVPGVNGVPEPLGPQRPSGAPTPATPSAAPPASDRAEFTQQASLASSAQQVIAATGGESAIRQEQVEAAKERIEAGTHRLQEVVLQVAARVARFVE